MLSPRAVLKPVIHLPNVGSRWRILPVDVHGCLTGKQWELLWALGGSAFLGQLSWAAQAEPLLLLFQQSVTTGCRYRHPKLKRSSCPVLLFRVVGAAVLPGGPLPCTPSVVPGEAASTALQLSCPLLTRAGAAGIVVREIRMGARTWNDCGIIESCTLKPPVLEANTAIKNGKQR